MVMLWTTRQRHMGVRTRKDSQWHTQVGFNNRTEIECETEWGKHSSIYPVVPAAGAKFYLSKPGSHRPNCTSYESLFTVLQGQT